MRKYLLVIFTLVLGYTVQSQTFTGTGGAIPDAGPQTCFPIDVSGVGAINGNYGLASVCLNISHGFDSDLEIILKAPDGNTVHLSIQNGASGDNYSNTCFTANATVPIESGLPPFSGNFLPQGYLGNVNNGQNADGQWSLCIQDKNAIDAGSLLNWSITFSDNPAAPPPVCKGNLLAGNICSLATAVCNFNEFCGNTSTSYTVDTWPELSAAFCGSIENNSFISFVASSSTVSFNVWVTNSLNGDGIDMMIFSGGCGSGPVTKYACRTGIVPTATGPTLVNATGLIIGNTYFIMIDGANADVCDYILVAASGINVLGIAQSKPAICTGQTMLLTASGGNGVYSWSPAEGLSSVNGSTVTANPDTTTVYTVTSTPLIGNCVLSNQVTVKVNLKPDIGPDQTINICPNGSVNLTTLYNTAGLTAKWTFRGNPVANPASIFAAGTYQLIASASSGCSDTASVLITINLKPNLGPDKQVNVCSGSPVDLTRQFVITSLFSDWSFNNNPVSTPEEVYNPGTYQLIISDGSVGSTCADTALLIIGNFTKPDIGPDKSISICPGDIVHLNDQFVLTGLTENWYYGNISLPIRDVLSGGTYKLVVNDNNSCLDTAFLTIVIKPKPFVGGNQDIKICSGMSVNLTSLYNTSGLTYNWMSGGVSVPDPANVTVAGTYILTITNSFGCSNFDTVTVITDPNLDLGPDKLFDLCPGSSVNLTTLYGTNGLTTEWTLNGNQVSGLSNVKNDGFYRLVASNGASCVDTAYITIINRFNPVLGPDVSAGFCTQSSLNLYKVFDTTGIAISKWTLNGMNIFKPQAVNVAGNYRLIAINAFGCADTAFVSVVSNPEPALGNDTAAGFCSGSSINLTGLYTSYFLNTWTFNNNPVPDPSTVNVPGIYQLVAANATGCSDTALVSITQYSKPELGPNKSVTICPGSSLGLTAQYNTAGLTTDWSINGVPVLNPSSITSNGNYRLIATNSNGCSDSAIAIVTIKPKPDLGPDKKVPFCAIQSIDLTSQFSTIGLTSKWTLDGVVVAWPNSANSDGVYQLIATNVSGCSDTALLSVILSPRPQLGPDMNIFECSNTATNLFLLFDTTGLSSNWTENGSPLLAPDVVSKTGQYQLIAANTFGCADTVLVNLNLKPVSFSTTTVVVCSNDLPYSWNGNSYSSAGTYDVSLINAVNCDSVATLKLTVNSVNSSTTQVTVCDNQLPYVWNGNSYSSGGIYNVVLTNAANCDSTAYLELTVNATSTSATSVTTCNNQLPYVWNGNSYSSAGTYNVILTNAAGCDSTATLELTVNSTSTSTTALTICSNQLPYLWNGTSFSSAGTYNVILTNAAGCDSTATLELTVNQTSSSITPVTICSNQLPYVWNGNSYSSAGTYNVILTNAVNCDSTATLELTVNATSSSTTPVTICSNQLPYVWNGNSYSSAGTYSIILTNALNCDSTATLELTVNSTSSSITNASVCSNYLPYVWNGNSYAASGTYNVTLINSLNCDSVATLVLTVYSTSSSTTPVTICSNQLPYVWNGNSYSSAGSYNFILTNAAGCDSVATLELTVNSTTSSTTNTSICEADLPYSWNGNSYSSAGTYNVVLVNAAGCDSTATLKLTVNKATTSTTSVNICGRKFPYTWNNNSFAAPGTYTVLLQNQFGCDSVATLILTEEPTDTSYTSFSICRAQLPYQWNGNSYSSAGDYTVNLLTSSGCDSVAALTLTVNDASSSTTDISICSGYLPYWWNGLQYNAEGTYSVTLKNQYGCDSIATLNLEVNLSTSSSESKTICNTDLPFTWNGVEYPFPGTYSETYVNAVGCDSVASFTLIVKQMPAVPALGNDAVICRGDKFILTPGNYDNYLWQDGTTNSTFNVENSGVYSVAVWEDTNCISRDTINVQVLENCGELFYPNAFTPNGDGRNDMFGGGPAEYILLIKNYSFQVFNRYGAIVFSTTDPYKKWDGTYQGKKMDPGTYAWSASYLFKNQFWKTQKGFVVLLR